MSTQPEFIGRDSHFVSWDRDGTASHKRTPMGPMEHESYRGITDLHRSFCEGNDRAW